MPHLRPEPALSAVRRAAGAAALVRSATITALIGLVETLRTNPGTERIVAPPFVVSGSAGVPGRQFGQTTHELLANGIASLTGVSDRLVRSVPLDLR